MKPLILPGSDNTPHCQLRSNGDFSFRGISKPEDAAGFYSEIMEWISDYYREPSRETHITLSFRYLNSSSSSMLLKMFYFLNKLQENGKTIVRCDWFYEEQDQCMLDYINRIKAQVDLIEFNVRPTDNVFDVQAAAS